MITYNSLQEIALAATENGKKIHELVIEQQAIQLGQPAEALIAGMENRLKVMETAAEEGLSKESKSISGISGGDAVKMKKHAEAGKCFGGSELNKILARALAVAEVNACMGRIVAAPTGGSCGILPSVLITVMEERRIDRDEVVKSMFTAAGIGMVIAEHATLAGAEGGCQAECGAGAAMAAGALVELLGGTPHMVVNACAIALKGLLGLVCDPVAGLVEVPCIKRNAICSAHAVAAANLALAGVESVIPVDEVIGAMKEVGDVLVPALKETADGGLAASPTARSIAERVHGEGW